MSRTIGVIVVTAVLALASSAWATIIESPESSGTTNYNSLISAADLVNNGQATLAATSTAGGPLLAGSPSGANDGVGQDGGVSWNGYSFVWDPITFQYDLAGSTTGYSITQVDVIAGWWAGEHYANQNWSIAVATLANPTFTTLKSVVYTPFATPPAGQEAFGYTHVRLTDDTGAIAKGVTAVQVTLYSPCVLSEIDVAGTATVPEPASSVMLAAGLISLLAYAWRKRR